MKAGIPPRPWAGWCLRHKTGCITPHDYEDYFREINELEKASELVVRKYVPSESEKLRAEEAIFDLATSPLPEEYFLGSSEDTGRYYIYPEKFLPTTWQALQDTNLAKKWDADERQWKLHTSIGVTLMSILADACSSEQRRKVTDSPLSQRAFASARSGLSGGAACAYSDAVDRLVNISMKVVDVGPLSLNRLIDYRLDEIAKPEGRQIRILRHKYLKKIDEQSMRLVQAISKGERYQDIEEAFEQEMKDDLADLKEALKINRNEMLQSQSVGVLVCAGAGVVIPQAAVPLTAMTGWSLVKDWQKYKQNRRAVLERHPVSWLMEFKGLNVPDWYYKLPVFPALG